MKIINIREYESRIRALINIYDEIKTRETAEIIACAFDVWLFNQITPEYLDFPWHYDDEGKFDD